MQTTKFEAIYRCFLSKVTDDMYMELDESETGALLEELMLNALPYFEFPRVNINNYDLYKKCYNVSLSNEEINIIAIYMMVCWFNQQLASVELTRMKYSGSDFKFTSQANHMSKLLSLKKDYERVGFHLQRLYKRRKIDKNGVTKSTFGSIMSTSVRKNLSLNNKNNYCDCNEELEWEDFLVTEQPKDDSLENMENEKSSMPDNDQWESM